MDHFTAPVKPLQIFDEYREYLQKNKMGFISPEDMLLCFEQIFDDMGFKEHMIRTRKLSKKQKMNQKDWDRLAEGKMPAVFKTVKVTDSISALEKLSEWIARQNKYLIRSDKKRRIRIISEHQADAPDLWWEAMRNTSFDFLMALPDALMPRVMKYGVEEMKKKSIEIVTQSIKNSRHHMKMRIANIKKLQGVIAKQYPGARYLTLISSPYAPLKSKELVADIIAKRPLSLSVRNELLFRHFLMKKKRLN